LAKNLFCDPGDRTLARKLSELLYALELEAILPKQRILELYINIVELGPQVYGVGPAADAYFIKRPARMTPSEAAFLASILPAPRTYYRRALGGNLPRARMAFVLDNMANGGVLTAHEAAVAKARPPRIVPLGNP
jgi:monofunctional biosynthetic peptidoglycan transglycosylase